MSTTVFTVRPHQTVACESSLLWTIFTFLSNYYFFIFRHSESHMIIFFIQFHSRIKKMHCFTHEHFFQFFFTQFHTFLVFIQFHSEDKKNLKKKYLLFDTWFFFFTHFHRYKRFFFSKKILIYCVIKIFLQDFKWKIKSVKPTAKKVCQIFILPGQKKFVIRIKCSCMKLDKDTFWEKN